MTPATNYLMNRYAYGLSVQARRGGVDFMVLHVERNGIGWQCYGEKERGMMTEPRSSYNMRRLLDAVETLVTKGQADDKPAISTP